MSVDARTLAAVFVGGAVGTLARAALATTAVPDPGRWPWPTFVANIVGSVLLGFIGTRLATTDIRRPLWGTGVCGGLTTFSTVQVETLLASPDGVLRDPAVSYDGKRILFAWKKADRTDDYHLYEMQADSRAVRQLTFGLGAADYEPAYLPGGDIVFASSRCVQTVDCWWTEVSNLYLCNGDGKYLRRVSLTPSIKIMRAWNSPCAA